MKKLIAMFLAALTALSLTACAAKSGAQPDALEIPDALTILNTVWASYSEDEKFPAAGGDYSEANMTDGQPGTVGLENASDVEYLLSIPASVVAMADDGASLFHMMNGNTFTCGAFHVTAKDDVESVAQDLRDAIQSKQWMCGFPDKLVIFTYDQYVVSLYGDEDLVNTFRDKFSAVYSDAAAAYDEAIL